MSEQKRKRWHHRASRRMRDLAEFRGIRRDSLEQYQSNVRALYDGPQGAVLHMSSLLSLHDPLMGKFFRKGHFDIASCERILDIGSGAGQIIKHLLRGCGPETEIVGIDLSYEMLKRARERLKSDRPFLMAGDLKCLPFADNTFDGVTCGYVLEHLPDPDPGLHELCRVLRPGGRLLLLATENSLSGILTSRTWKCRTFSRPELREAAKRTGFRWSREHWFTRFHQLLRLGGILVELQKPESEQPASESDRRDLAAASA